MAVASFLTFLLATTVLQTVVCYRIPSLIIKEQSARGACLESVSEAISNASLQIQRDLLLCGPGNWIQVVNLNMSDPRQNCPSPWRTRTSPGRSCGTPSLPCTSVYHDTDIMYQKVCGFAEGYAVGSPDAFLAGTANDINLGYLDGVSITHGQPREHIWSLAVGVSTVNFRFFRCPCDNPDRNQARLPPSFVGENYFCDSNFINETVWDGQCVSDCCSFHSPPLFKASLPAPTTHRIEVRICQSSGTRDEEVLLKSLSLFVQ